ncbi:MAG: hypothetical protein AABY22_13235 [Nanoarchaeota archaeon]
MSKPKENYLKSGKKLARKNQRRTEAKERQSQHNKLTKEQKIAKLDNKLGKGIGAIKERAKYV